MPTSSGTFACSPNGNPVARDTSHATNITTCPIAPMRAREYDGRRSQA
jgi:hypothetical protein